MKSTNRHEVTMKSTTKGWGRGIRLCIGSLGVLLLLETSAAAQINSSIPTGSRIFGVPGAFLLVNLCDDLV